MKKLLLLSLCVSLGFSCSEQKTTEIDDNIQNDLTKENIQGKVRSITYKEYQIKANFGDIIKEKESSKEIIYYNEYGNKMEQSRYLWGELYILLKYKYDKNNNLIEENEYNKDGKEESRIIYKYDKNNNLIEENKYNKDGKEESRIIYKYNQSKKIIQRMEYDIYGNQAWKYKSEYALKYPKEGDIHDGVLRQIGEYTYEKDVKIISSGITEERYKYNQEKKIIEESNHSMSRFDPYQDTILQDSTIFSQFYRYNTNGDLIVHDIEHYICLKDGTKKNIPGQRGVIKRKHKYEDLDKNGNWKIMTSFYVNDNTVDKPYRIADREIEYYE